MHHSCGLGTLAWSVGALAVIVAAAPARADAISAVQVLRAGGCGGMLPAAPPLRRTVRLDRVAEEWAAGATLAAAAERAGYRAAGTVGLHLTGEGASLPEVMRRSVCATVMEQTLREVGVHRRGEDNWLVMMGGDASPRALPPPPDARPREMASGPSSAPLLAARALQLINEVRARGTSCGTRSFAPAPPVSFSGTLSGVALGHATDMAQHGYFEHQDLNGQSPADRVRAVGYHEKLVGENIAYGPRTVEEVVQGWLGSADHCENIMDPRFAEMGIAYAAGHTARRGLYWVQVLAAPGA